MDVQPDEGRSLAEIAKFLRRLQFLAVAGLALWVIWLLSPILIPFVLGAILGWLGDPLVDRLERAGRSRSSAVLLVYSLMLLILALAGLSMRLGLGIEQRLVISAARTTIQLLLIGLVLKLLFDNVHFLWVAAMAAVMITAAGREVMARQKRRFTGGWGFGLGTLSMFVSSFTVSVLALVVVIGNTPCTRRNTPSRCSAWCWVR